MTCVLPESPFFTKTTEVDAHVAVTIDYKGYTAAKPKASKTSEGWLLYAADVVYPTSMVYEKESIDVVFKKEEMLSFEELKSKIGVYFKEHDGEEIGLDVLMDYFPCSLRDLTQACDELESEGKIAEA